MYVPPVCWLREAALARLCMRRLCLQLLLLLSFALLLIHHTSCCRVVGVIIDGQLSTAVVLDPKYLELSTQVSPECYPSIARNRPTSTLMLSIAAALYIILDSNQYATRAETRAQDTESFFTLSMI